jgi:hypothetical protein
MEDLLSHVRSILSGTPARWQNLAETFPAGLFAQPPAPAQWSAMECIQHIIDTESLFQSRIRAFLAGQDFPGFNPDREGTHPGPGQTPAAMAASFARMRAESLASLAEVTPADLDRRVRHQELGPVTLREMINEWAAHDLNHTVQAERALMQPFIRASGPWQVYFKDHVIEE